MKLRTTLLLGAALILLPAMAFSVFVVDRFASRERERHATEAQLIVSRIADRTELFVLRVEEALRLVAAGVPAPDAVRARLMGAQKMLDIEVEYRPPSEETFIFAEAAERLVDGPAEATSYDSESGKVEIGIAVGFGPEQGRIVGHVTPVRLSRVIVNADVPQGWTAAILDSEHTIIARSRDVLRYAGARGTEDLRRNATQAAGTWLGTTKEGTPVLAAYRKMPLGWMVAVGAPLSAVDSALRNFLWWLSGLGFLTLALSVGGGLWIGRRLEVALRALRHSAMLLASGRELRRRVLGVAELDRAYRSLRFTSNLLRRRTRARDAAVERLQTIIDTLPVGVLELDASSRITLANLRAEALLRNTREHLEGHALRDEDWFVRSDADERSPSIRLAGGEAFENVIYQIGGGGMFFSVSGRGVERGGDRVGSVIAFADVSARIRAETALEEEQARLATLNRTGQLIASELDVDKLVQSVTDAGVELTGAEFGAFFYNVVGGSGEVLQLYALSGAPRERFSQFEMPRKTDVFAPTFEGRAIVRSDDITKDSRYGLWEPYRGMPKGHLPVRSYLAVPVISRKRDVLGGLFFGHSRSGVFGEAAERLVAGIAGQAAIALDNATLFAQAQDEIRRRTHAEDAHRLVARELNHRVKNLFAVMSGLVTMISRTAPSAAQMGRDLRSRIHALARAHELIRPALSDGEVVRTSLAELVRVAIEPHRSEQSATLIEGPHVALQPAAVTPLAMVLHELATNAAKYGVLAGTGGELRVSWVLDEEQLTLDWRESNVKTDFVGASPGFGSLLIRASVEQQLGGTIHRDFSVGLEVVMRIPRLRVVEKPHDAS